MLLRTRRRPVAVAAVPRTQQRCSAGRARSPGHTGPERTPDAIAQPPTAPSPTADTMQRLIAALALSSAAAFVAPVAPAASTALRAVEEFEVGVQAPAGFFDPLNYCEDQPESFARRRAVERKHGRISMMAFVGILVHNADIEFPGYISKSQGVKFSDIPDGIYGFSKIPAAGVLGSSSSRASSSSRGGPRRTTRATAASASGARGRARTSCRS